MNILNNFSDFLKKEKLYSECTVSSYITDIKQFISFLNINEEKEITKTTKNDIRKWIIYLYNKKISASSIQRKVSSLKTFFKYLQRESLISDIPVKNIVLPKKHKRLPVFINEAEIINLLDNVEYSNERDKIVITLLYYTGMRCAELVNVKISDIDSERKTIKIFGKRKKERIIPLSDKIINEINKYLKFRNSLQPKCDNLIVTNKGTKAYNKFIYRIVNKYLKIYSTISKKSPHVLRHSIATHLLNRGANINAIKEFLGHANLAATQVYTHNSLEQLKNIYNKYHPRT
ncbi:MAG: tyrosine-type recombinase/integrase [Bacteroidales bacterium]|nr:tyrosine-type recombinase/integrase [Bacteroidales bacterium]